MQYQEPFIEFTKKFNNTKNGLRGIGIEAELPIVTHQGEAVSLSIIQNLFGYLEKEGFQIEKDSFSNYMISASRVNAESAQQFDSAIDVITLDTGYSTLEIALAPQTNLHTIQFYFSEIMAILVNYFHQQNCSILGYGIQPITPPSRRLLLPKERYLFFEKFSPNNIIPKSEGADAHLLTITASNQCHIDISRKDAIQGTNVLNALSGLQIIFHANSPIWGGKIDATYKANREIFWEFCYPDRVNQMGIPPRFESIEDYIDYLLLFKPMLVKRDNQLLQILNKETFKDFLLNKTPTIGQTLAGKKLVIHPRKKDIHDLNAFCYFNARLVPKYGTIESRMCCQQPPNETLTPTAVTLGLLENLEAAATLMEKFPWETWKEIRLNALQHTFKTSVNGKSLLPVLTEFLDIATQGLKKRGLGEAVFLAPLYERLKRKKAPADEAINIFEKQGMKGFLEHCSFKTETFSMSNSYINEIQNI